MNLPGLNDFMQRNPNLSHFTLAFNEESNELFGSIASHLGNIVEMTLSPLKLEEKNQDI